MKQSIFINNMRFRSFHGVMQQEKTVGGDFSVSVCINGDFSQAVKNDNICHTVNYAEVYDCVKQQMSIRSALIEHVAGRIVKSLFGKFSAIDSVCLTIIKDNPPMGADSDGAGFTISCTREEAANI